MGTEPGIFNWGENVSDWMRESWERGWNRECSKIRGSRLKSFKTGTAFLSPNRCQYPDIYVNRIR